MNMYIINQRRGRDRKICKPHYVPDATLNKLKFYDQIGRQFVYLFSAFNEFKCFV